MAKDRRRFVTPYWRLIARSWLGNVVCVLALVTGVCGLIGFYWQYVDRPQGQAGNGTEDLGGGDPSIPIYKTVQLFLLNSGAEDDSDHPSNWLLIVARMSAALLFLVVSWAVIRTVLEEARKLPRLLARRDHVVICGLGQIGLQLLDDLNRRGRGDKVVIVEKNAGNAWLSYARSLGASVVLGDSTKSDTLLEAGVPYAAEVFAVTGDDGANLEITAELGTLLSEFGNPRQPVQLYVHILDANLATTLRPYDSILHDTPDMQVHVFNVPRTAAVQIVTEQLWPHAPQQRDEVSHFVILGFGPMGRALAVQLAQLAHFPNCKRSRFTIADYDVRRAAGTFLKRFSNFTVWSETGVGVKKFDEAADHWDAAAPTDTAGAADNDQGISYVCNAEFLDLSEGCNDILLAQNLYRALSAEGVKPVIFVCGQQDRENFDTAVQLRDQLSNLGLGEAPFFVWLPRQPALAETLARDGSFYPFGGSGEAASYDEITRPMRELVGKAIHDAYEAYAVAQGEQTTATPWESLWDPFRESSRVAADHLVIKLTALGYRLREESSDGAPSGGFEIDDPSKLQLLSEMEHYRWVAERLLAGWRYVPKGGSPEEIKKNKLQKRNHNLVPWASLEHDQRKDYEQVHTVLQFFQRDGLSLEKLPAAAAEIAPTQSE